MIERLDLLAVPVLALGVTLAMPVTSVGAAAKAAPSKADREFMHEAASGGLMLVELGMYATQHAASDRVKQFGQTMVDDHTKANDELKQVAVENDVKLPAAMNKEQRATADRLMKMKGAAFDRAYMKTMVEDHEHDVTRFRKESQSAHDPGVKSFAAKTLPTLEHHLEMAKEVSAHVGKATSGAGAHHQ
jgi:putative membrane protein